MKKFNATLLPFLVFAIANLFSCNPGPAPNENTAQAAVPAPVELETITLQKEQGDCVDPSPEKSCALVKLAYPAVKNGNDALKNSVNTWALDFMLGMLDPSLEMDQEQTLDAAIQSFFTLHEESLKDFPDGALFYTVDVSDTVLLNDGKHLTLRLDGYSFAGGAHGNPTSAVSTFDVATGQAVTMDAIVTSLDTLQQRAEQKFREVRQEDFAQGFEFDQVFMFKLADNIGLLDKGLFFCYVPYEVGPYAMGYTEFVLPFSEISDILTKKME
jgi:hypothetical protein